MTNYVMLVWGNVYKMIHKTSIIFLFDEMVQPGFEYLIHHIALMKTWNTLIQNIDGSVRQ